MKIVIPGEPIPKARPRFFSKGGKKLAYNNQSTEMTDIAWYIKEASLKCKFEAFADAYEIELKFFFRPPSTNRNPLLWGIEPCLKRCDLDNLEKTYLDCAIGILYHDDSVIIELSSSKHYSDRPRTEISIMAKKTPILLYSAYPIIKTFSPDSMQDFLDDLDILYHFSQSLDSNLKQVVNLSDPDQKRNFEEFSDNLTNFCTKHSEKLSKIAKSAKDEKSYSEGKTLKKECYDKGAIDAESIYT